MQKIWTHDRTRKTAGLMAVLLAVLFFCSPLSLAPSSAEAKSVSDMQNQVDSLSQQIKDLQNKLNANQGKLADEKARQEQLTEQILNIEQQVSLYNEKIDEVNKLITAKEEEISEKEAEIKESEELFAARLRRMYITNTSSSTLSTLLSASSFSDFLNRYEILKRISQEDRSAIEVLNQQKNEYEEMKADLDAKKAELKEASDSVSAKSTELKNLYAESEANESSILQANKQYMENAQKYKKEQEALEAEIQKMLQNEGSSDSYGDGKLKWPVPTRSYISSYFGWRTLYGKPNYHKGIDIPGAAGTNIVAADAGKVLRVEKLTYGYGWHVIIDHGNGVATLYGHCSRLDVSVGQVVQKGQVIAGIGTTGNSTGNHVHFEVRIKGKQENPLNYVKQPS